MHSLSIAVFLYPNVGSTFRSGKNGKLQLRTPLVLISFKSLFCVRNGTDVLDCSLEWKLMLSDIKRVLVRDDSVLIVTREREELREFKMQTKEEAFLVYRKISRSLEVDRSIEADTPSKFSVSTTQLVAHRNPMRAAQRALDLVEKGLEKGLEKGVDIGMAPLRKGKEELFDKQEH